MLPRRLVPVATAGAMPLPPPLGIMIVATLVLLVSRVGEQIVSGGRQVSHVSRER
ncbi:hypothetical protein AB0J86_05325 [Micromonospora sp. NPDC049559]|uniref:hypothetical protein n=1 Tax=Micromonospora sp. NPDC049559 TaxID=3155923 RepID=UPI0034496AA7